MSTEDINDRQIQNPESLSRIKNKDQEKLDKSEIQLQKIRELRGMTSREGEEEPEPEGEEEPEPEGDLTDRQHFVITETPVPLTGPTGPPGPKGDQGEKGDIGFNEYHVTCKAEKLLPTLDRIYAMNVSLNDTMLRLEAMTSDVKNILEDLLELNEHVHYSHSHPKGHYAEQGIHVEYGSYFLPLKPDESALLVNEFNNGIDKDDNGLVYGVDFIISIDDPRKPQVLRGLEDILIEDGKQLPSIQLTWADYLQTLPYDPNLVAM